MPETIKKEVLFTKSDLGLIPTATPEMSIEELRDICVSFLRAQEGFVWTPNVTYTYPCRAGSADENGNLTHAENTVYSGIPYTHISGNLYTMMDFCDAKTGVFSVPDLAFYKKYIGNDCADAVFWAWARVSSSIDFILTRYMNPSHGLLRVGSYTFDDKIDDFHFYHTSKICEENGDEVMFSSYAEVRKADGFVMYGTGGGHTILASADAVTVRREDGSIDPEKSYVLFLEQSSSERAFTLSDGGKAVSIGGCENGSANRFSFSQLRQKNYIPITIKELAGERQVEEPRLSLSEEIRDLETLLSAKVNSNFRLSSVTLTFCDSARKMLSLKDYCMERTMFAYPISEMPGIRELLDFLAPGGCTVSVKALISTGQELSVSHNYIKIP